MHYPIIASPAFSDAATVTGAPTPGSMGVSNLLEPQPTDVMRFSSLTGMYFKVDLGAVAEIIYVWLGYTNASAGATIRWRAAATEAELITNPTYDETVPHWPQPYYAQGGGLETWPRNHHYLNLLGDGNSVIARWWRADITDDGNEAGYYQAGRLLMSPNFVTKGGVLGDENHYLWQSSRGAAADGIEVGINEEVRRIRSEGGQIFARVRPRPRVITIPFLPVEKEEAYSTVDAIGRLRGVSQEVLMIIDPDDLDYIHQQTVYGLMSEPMKSRIIGTSPPTWQVTIKVEEMT